MTKILALALLVAASSSYHGGEPHTIVDSQGEVGQRDPLGWYYLTVPEIDMLWVDVVPGEDMLEVSWRVENLSHRTFAPSLEGLIFICSWGLMNPDGTPGGTQAVVAQRYTTNGLGFWTSFVYDDGPNDHDVDGEFDWANNTVRMRVPMSHFESGASLLDPIAWSWAKTQNKVSVFTSVIEVGDRAPNSGWETTDVPIP